MRVSGLPSFSRTLQLFAAGLVGGAILSLVVLTWRHGARFTVGWLLGYSWPFPQNFEITSAWWLLSGFSTWVVVLTYLLRHGDSAIRALAAAAGPTAALVIVATWTTSLLLYVFQVWPIDAPPTGIRWLVDGPIMDAWRKSAHWLLWQVRINGATEPVHYADGSSLHMPGVMHVLGLLNEAVLAAVLSMLFVMGIHVIWATRSRRHQAA